MTPGQEHDWRLYTGSGVASSPVPELPEAPPWRRYTGSGTTSPPAQDDSEADRRIGAVRDQRHTPGPGEVDAVNTAIRLRRPLLLTGTPGSGKSSLAYRIARELGLGPVLRWPITSRVTLVDGLVDTTPAEPRLGPLGTALLPYARPRVLLIDELDRAQLDLPEEILAALDAGEYLIPTLTGEPEKRVATHDRNGSATVRHGVVGCQEFPVVIITCVGEREFSPGFLRRCLHLRMRIPTGDQLMTLIAAQVGPVDEIRIRELVDRFLARTGESGGLGIDQLLDAVHLARTLPHNSEEWDDLLTIVWHSLASVEPE